MASKFTLVLFTISSLLVLTIPKSESSSVPVSPGLSYSFYASKCPNLEIIIRNHLKKVFIQDITQAAGLLRLHFHDCFVQGCDGSVLLDGSTSGPSEQSAPPNLSLRKEAFKIINDLRALVQKACGQIISCADIVALAARDSVALSGGPDYEIPLGRRDGLTFANLSVTLANLPAPTSSAAAILNALANNQKLDATDTIALSGGHTIGRSHCSSFGSRLYPTVDPTMDKTFAKNLKGPCPTNVTNNTVNMDIRSPNLFDNKYYVDLMNRQGLFTSDQDLYTYSKTRDIVTSFAVNQSLFFEKFVIAMLKMGQLGVLTGNQGEIRANCSARNAKNVDLWSVVEEQGQGSLSQF